MLTRPGFLIVAGVVSGAGGVKPALEMTGLKEVKWLAMILVTLQ